MRCARRTLLGAGVTAAASLAGCTAPPASRPASRRTADYAERLVETLRRYLLPTPDHPRHPSYAGAVALVAVDGEMTVHEAVGDALRYGPDGVELAPEQRVAMRQDSIFDLASITKVYTAVLAMQQVDAGRLALDAPVAEYLTGFAERTVTIKMLLAHTSGLPDLDLTRQPTPAARRAALLAVRPKEKAGTVFRYSDVGMQFLGLVLEQVTGQPLDLALVGGLLRPLALRDTGFRPADRLAPADLASRIAATEVKKGRGLVRGVVHDEGAYALGGVAGHAGLFATAMDVAAIGQLLLDRGEFGMTRVLAAATAESMLVDLNVGLPVRDPENRPGRGSHGLGVELNQSWYMGRLAGPRAFGHTGFTGTSLVVDPTRRLVSVLLTNRVHPDRAWGQVDAARVAVSNVLADGIAPRYA